MGILNRLFHHKESQTAVVACPHTALTARWDQVADIGKQDLATGFHCESCGEDFSGEAGRQMLRERER
jgi:hypothetical protein